MGIRVVPDGYDIIVWNFDEGSSPFQNSSTTGAYSALNSQLTATGTIYYQQPSPFAPYGTTSAIRFPGPAASNYAVGAGTVEPQPPVTFSGWYFNRSYHTTGNYPGYFLKVRTPGSFQGPYVINPADYGVIGAQYLYGIGSSDINYYIHPVAGSASVRVPQSLGAPLNAWSHVGMTYDGTNLNVYTNGNLVGSAVNASGPSNINYFTHGQWYFGATTSINIEPITASMCDFRIANIVRPQSYFQNIYRLGATTFGYGKPFHTYYKLRAYDLSCLTPTPVYWTSTKTDYTDAPSAPCGSLGPIEIMETWAVLG